MVSQALQRFTNNLPNRPYCSSDKWVRDIQPRDSAVNYPYIQVNYPRIHYLVFDLDDSGAVFAPEKYDMPVPTITAINRESGYAHLLYEIAQPIPRKHSGKTRQLISDIKDAYKDILCADKCIIGQQQLIKNPLHSKWDVNPLGGGAQFGLGELAEYIPKQWKIERHNRMGFSTSYDGANKTFEECLTIISRTCTLFEYGRYYAYAIVSGCASYDALYEHVMKYISDANDREIAKYFPVKLPYSEIKSIVKSIAKWTFKHRHHFMKVRKVVNAGAMNLPTMKGKRWGTEEYKEEVMRRQQISAERTHKVRRQSTIDKILSAKAQCISDGIEPTTAVVSELSGVSKSTITRSYYNIIQSG